MCVRVTRSPWYCALDASVIHGVFASTTAWSVTYAVAVMCLHYLQVFPPNSEYSAGALPSSGNRYLHEASWRVAASDGSGQVRSGAEPFVRPTHTRRRTTPQMA